MTRVWTTAIACASLLLANSAIAAKPGAGNGPQGQAGGGQAGAEHGKAHHQHVHKNGHALLGEKLKQDGKHALGKLGNRDVTADVKGGKVVGMAAGDLPVKRVKTKNKMASIDGAFIQAAWNPNIQLAQYDDYYYGYCFDDASDYDCYWYPASDVDYQDYTWDDYDPYY